MPRHGAAVRVHAVVSGQVQGVGFRYFTVGQARRLGLGGFVRNLPDGRVEVHAEGSRPALDALVTALRDGPPGAVVRDVQTDWQDLPPRETEFVIR